MDREIFEYWNGKRKVKADPMAVAVAFQRACAKVDIQTVMSKFQGPDWLAPEEDGTPKYVALGIPEEQVKLALARRAEAVEELIPVLCQAFGVKTIADDPEDGMTYAEILGVFGELNLFVDRVKKNTVLNVQTQPSTADTLPLTITKGNSATTTTPAGPSDYRHSPRRRGSRSPSAASPTGT